MEPRPGPEEGQLQRPGGSGVITDDEMKMVQNPPAHRGRRAAALLFSLVGALILGADIVIGFPFLLTVLRDPTSHEAMDAGMMAIFLLIPMALAGIACLLVGYLLWRTRAGGVALVTASAVVVMVWGNLGGIPLLTPAIGVAIAGFLLVLWFVYRGWRGHPTV